MNTIELGDSGRDVVVWQRFLTQTWFAEAEDMLHGEFDAATDEATRAFQLAQGLNETGIVDRLTREKAQLQGLAAADNAVPWQPTGRTWVWFTLVVCIASWTMVTLINAQPFILAAGGKVALPVPSMFVPNSPPIRQCPSMFC